MKLFISYARVDKPLCIQIAERLSNVHEIWYDRRLHAGQAWWDEIVRHLNWCEGFVYLLSPESYESEYCQREFEIAQKNKKHLFPVVIRTAKGGKILIPDALNHIHYADLSQDMQALNILMDALTIAERSLYSQPLPQPVASPETVEQPGVEITPGAAIGQAADALEAGDFDKAVFILKQAQEKPSSNRNARMIKSMLAEAEAELERQAYLREAEREYAPIVELVKRERTRSIGCDEFAEFQKDFPDYDPENLAEVCGEAKPAKPYRSTLSGKPDFSSVKVIDSQEPELDSPQPYNPMDWLEGLASRQAIKDELPTFTPPDVSHILPGPFEWCYIPQGFVTLEDASGDDGTKGGRYKVPAFYIAKYPITNAQYQVFMDAADGYQNAAWWDYSGQAQHWHKRNPKPVKTAFPGENLPRTKVNWYESIAFCRWLSVQLPTSTTGAGMQITLPTEQQWQRAAQGDDDHTYPWGNKFDPQRGNTIGTGIGQPCSVTQFPDGASPFGAFDMVGNVFEWCLTRWGKDNTVLEGDSPRVVRGGGFLSTSNYCRAAYRGHHYPFPRNHSLGFRVVCGSPSTGS